MRRRPRDRRLTRRALPSRPSPGASRALRARRGPSPSRRLRRITPSPRSPRTPRSIRSSSLPASRATLGRSILGASMKARSSRVSLRHLRADGLADAADLGALDANRGRPLDPHEARARFDLLVGEPRGRELRVTNRYARDASRRRDLDARSGVHRGELERAGAKLLALDLGVDDGALERMAHACLRLETIDAELLLLELREDDLHLGTVDLSLGEAKPRGGVDLRAAAEARADLREAMEIGDARAHDRRDEPSAFQYRRAVRHRGRPRWAWSARGSAPGAAPPRRRTSLAPRRAGSPADSIVPGSVSIDASPRMPPSSIATSARASSPRLVRKAPPVNAPRSTSRADTTPFTCVVVLASTTALAETLALPRTSFASPSTCGRSPCASA